MICPNCGEENLPGSEECSRCQQDLTQLDRPTAQNRIEQSLMEEPVSVLAPRKPLIIKPDTTIQSAIQTMLVSDIGALLVVDARGSLIGVFSERDLLTKVAGVHEALADIHVEQFMTRNPETVKADDTLAFTLHKMDVGGYRHVPVVENGRPIGMVSVRDMLRYITQLL
jgi:CBS domain-containing protein